MATLSILKNINIRKKKLIRSFVAAMEHAQEKTAKDVQYSRTVSDVKGEELKKIFGDNK